MQDFINSWSIALGPTCTLGWNEQATPKEHLETMHTVCTNAMAHIKDDISKVEAAQDLASQLVEEGVWLIPEPRTTGIGHGQQSSACSTRSIYARTHRHYRH